MPSALLVARVHISMRVAKATVSSRICKIYLAARKSARLTKDVFHIINYINTNVIGHDDRTS
jgi:hypothetical protein